MAQATPAKPLSRDLILGSWKMTSWVTRDVATGERHDAWVRILAAPSSILLSVSRSL